MQQKKELNWVNAAKALCMIAVLFVHSENYYGMRLGELNPFIGGFYVNAFFMISGYLLFKKQLTAPAIGADCVQYATGEPVRKVPPSVSSTPARIAQKADCTLRSGLFGQAGG